MLSSPIPLLIGIKSNGKEYRNMLNKHGIKPFNHVTIFLEESIIIHD